MEDKNNKIFTVALIAVLAVFIIITVVTKKESGPMQSETLRALERIENNLSGSSGTDSAAILLTQQDLQKRVTALETKLEMILAAGGGGPKGSPQQAPQRPPPEDLNTVHDLTVGHSPVRGNPGAKVTIVEFVDFQCPFCARFHPPVNDVLAAYPNDVNYMVKNFPLSFHPEAKPASKAAFAAGEQGKYFEMVDLILEDNQSLSSDHFRELAKELGLDMNKFEQDLKNNDSKYEDWIKKDMELGLRSDVRGTPTFYLNGKKTMARSLPQFKSEVDAILGQ